MTGTEQLLINMVVGLLGIGGGIWGGSRGKVREGDCLERHKQLTADRAEIKTAIQAGFREIKDEIKDQFCILQGEDKAIYNRLNDHEKRISFVEGGKQS